MSLQRNELHLLTGSYAIDALPQDERAVFERHLGRCHSCAEEVRGLRETAARLAMAPAIAPPPEMRERVLVAAKRTRQLPPTGLGPLGRAGEGTGLRPFSRSRAGLAVAFLTLAAAVTFLLVLQLGTHAQLRQAQDANHAIAAVLAAPDARIESLPTTVGGTVSAVVSIRDREAVVTTADVPHPPGTKVYQLWVMNAAGTARPAGLLTITSSGSATPVLADGVTSGDRLGITVEPAGGSSHPTSTPVVIIPVTA